MANEIMKGGGKGLAFLRIFLFTIFFSFFAIFNVHVESSKNRRACFGAYFLFLLVHAEHSENPVLIRVRDPSVKIDKKSKEKSRGQKRIIMSQWNP